MKLFLAIFLAVIVLSGCNERKASDIKLSMEVAYPAFGNITGEPRVWAIYRAPLSLVGDMSPDTEVRASIRCATGTCAIDRVDLKAVPPQPQSESTISGRLLQRSEESHEAILLLEPFPVNVSQALHGELQYQPDVTKLVEVRYGIGPNGLVFQEIRLVGRKKKTPMRWK